MEEHTHDFFWEYPTDPFVIVIIGCKSCDYKLPLPHLGKRDENAAREWMKTWDGVGAKRE